MVQMSIPHLSFYCFVLFFQLSLKPAAINLRWSQIRLMMLISNSFFSILQKVNDPDGVRAKQKGLLLRPAGWVPGRGPACALGRLEPGLRAELWGLPFPLPCLVLLASVSAQQKTAVGRTSERWTQAPPPVPGLAFANKPQQQILFGPPLKRGRQKVAGKQIWGSPRLPLRKHGGFLLVQHVNWTHPFPSGW